MKSLSSLSDEGHVEPVEPIRRPRVFLPRQDHFEFFNDAEFKARYRFNKATVMEMLHTFGPKLEAQTCRNQSLTALNHQILIAVLCHGGHPTTPGGPQQCRQVHRLQNHSSCFEMYRGKEGPIHQHADTGRGRTFSREECALCNSIPSRVFFPGRNSVRLFVPDNFLVSEKSKVKSRL